MVVNHLLTGMILQVGMEKNGFYQIAEWDSIPYHPWDWYIYLHEWLKLMVNVGKYTIHGLFGYGFLKVLYGFRRNSKRFGKIP